MGKVVCFIDGFNVYHALNDNEKHPEYRKYKWLNYWKLAERFVRNDDQLVRVLLFTAYAHWMPDKVERHERLVKAVEAQGVEMIPGRFKRKQERCRKCHKYYWTHREKRTDVNIATYLLKLAFLDRFDTAIVISADGDLIPVIEAARELFPNKRVGVVTPIGLYNKDLREAASFWREMKLKDLSNSQLDDEIVLDSGERLTSPRSWRKTASPST